MKKSLLTSLLLLSAALPAYAEQECTEISSYWLLKAKTPAERSQQAQTLNKRLALIHTRLPAKLPLPQLIFAPEQRLGKVCFPQSYPLENQLALIQKRVFFEIRQPLKGHPDLWTQTGLQGAIIEKITLQPNQTLEIQLKAESAEILARLSAGLEEQQLGLFLDDKLLFAPVVKEIIPQGKFLISGNFKRQELERLAQELELSQEPLEDIELLAIQNRELSQNSLSRLPEPARKLLDKHYPGWTFPNALSAIGQSQYWQEKPDFTPFLVQADFDGNRTEDLAVQIRYPAGSEGPHEAILMLRLLPSGHYLPEVLQEVSAKDMNPWASASLWRYPSGTEMYDFNRQEAFQTTYETLSLSFWGKAAVAWIWNGKGFSEVMIGD